MERRFTYADHRRGRKAARRLEPRVVETGDDGAVDRAGPAHLADKPGDGEHLVVVALDAGWPGIGIDGDDLGGRQGGGTCRHTDLFCHRSGGVGIDDEKPHQTSPPRYSALTRASFRRSAELPLSATEPVVRA